MTWESNAPNGGFSPAKPWLPVPPEHNTFAVNREAADPHSTLAHYKRMLAFRRAHPALRSGAIRFLDAPRDVLAFVREGGGEAIACLFNFSGEAVRVALPASLKLNALDGHGFAGRLEGRAVELAGGDAFFGAIV